MNGAYWQAFGLKTQARVVCHPLSRRAPLRMLEGGLRGVRARSERPLDTDAPSPPAPFFARRSWKEQAARPDCRSPIAASSELTRPLNRAQLTQPSSPVRSPAAR